MNTNVDMIDSLIGFIRHRHSDNRVTRAELVRHLGLPDREARLAIQYAATAGYPVLSSSTGAGYWWSDDPDEIDRAIADLESRILALSLRKAGLKKAWRRVVRTEQTEMPLFST
jgi:hypothetical protein